MTSTPKATPLISRDNFDLVTTYCIIDDFFKIFDDNDKSKVGRRASLSISDIATITLIGCVYECGCLKSLYKLLFNKFSLDFKLPRYQNFVNTMNKYSVYLLKFIVTVCKFNNKKSGIITFCDSTKIEVCKIYREYRHRTMKLLATKSKSTTGWFYGMRLHVLCDQYGNLMQIKFTTATVGERKVLDDFLGKLNNCIVVADGGYVSSLLSQKTKRDSNNTLITAVRKNMKTLHTIWQSRCLNLRSRIESVFGELKERYNLVTSLPRSINGYLAYYIRSIFGYMVLS
ncbi:MAG: IS982 family transposase [Patescibacteria group bacterium]